MTTIYRVQDADGRGPWKPGFSKRWVEDRPDQDNLPPWFEEFGRVDQTAPTWEHIGSGCLSLNQLRRWFTPGEYRWLRSHGYRSVAMDVDRILGASKVQVLFARTKPLAEDVQPFELYPVVPA